ncbi:hypothetical protein [Saccharothrix syringae]|uniref:PASTA domain-containing protein n=1 Tax=Saccharothrix syringae TaxID=103733 RepID=A0A5Q0HBX6_SACSY|nr:hypothetical protein [Saccharothrix syringae]QFZ23162.1 hypothetical protein EKG83_42120 [Saccharothrix syringae]
MLRPLHTLPILLLFTTLTLSACSESSSSTQSSPPATSSSITTTTTPPRAPFVDTKSYFDQLADATKTSLEGKGYTVTVRKDGTQQEPVVDQLSAWRVVSVVASRTSAEATLYVRSAERTPQEKVDLAVEQAGLKSTISSIYESPSAMVTDICRSLSNTSILTPTEFLSGQSSDPQHLEVFKIGIPLLCPEHQKALQNVVEGKVPLRSGTYEVGTEKGQVKPGTYRTTGSVDDCYWERTRDDGEIIDNNFATHAKSITVTISPTDGSFTSERCGSWELVE